MYRILHYTLSDCCMYPMLQALTEAEKSVRLAALERTELPRMTAEIAKATQSLGLAPVGRQQAPLEGLTLEPLAVHDAGKPIGRVPPSVARWRARRRAGATLAKATREHLQRYRAVAALEAID
jgi:hypothetical protein